jgi:hypothetical protein
MMLELILRKCRDDNFISLIHGPDRNDARRAQDGYWSTFNSIDLLRLKSLQHSNASRVQSYRRPTA